MKRQYNYRPGVMYFSPSQVKTFRDCKRKWGFAKIDKIKEPQSDKMKFGEDCHEHLENWQLEGIAPPPTITGLTAQQLIRAEWMPPPRNAGTLVEQDLDISISESVALMGFSDLIWNDGAGPIITDYKFTSNKIYMLEPHELAVDPQALIYAEYGFRRFDVDEIRARWLYGVATNPKSGKRKPNGAYAVEHTFKRDSQEYKQAWQRLLVDIEEMTAFKTTMGEGEASTIDPNPIGCEKYGGCHYRKIQKCSLDGSSVLAAHFAQFDLEHKKQLTHCADNGTVPSKEINPMGSLLDKLKASAAATNESKPEEPKQEQEPPQKPDQGSLLAKLQTMTKEQGVNPPAQESKPEEPEQQTAAPVDSDAKEQCPHCSKSYKHLAKHKCPQAPSETVETKSGESVPRTNSVTGEDIKPREERPNLVVMFDAAFLKNNGYADGVAHLADVLQPVKDRIAKDNNAEHWTMTGHWVDAKNTLQRKFEHFLQNGGVPEGTVILANSSTSDCQVVRDILVKHASVVVQG